MCDKDNKHSKGQEGNLAEFLVNIPEKMKPVLIILIQEIQISDLKAEISKLNKTIENLETELKEFKICNN